MRQIIRRGFRSLQTRGLRNTCVLTVEKTKLFFLCRRKAQTIFPDERELERQRNQHFSKPVTFSILTPLYNTSERFLRDMIASVQSQTYPHWELCLCDASDEEHCYVGAICEEFMRQDARIRYRSLPKNEGISGNTNACIELASGDYYAVLDHDDILHPSALFYAAEAITQQGADFIYTDEAKFRTEVRDFFDPAYKPDFAKDDLRAHNYICHLTVYSRELLEQTGLYDSDKDGSQDHDMVLRMTEKARRIIHIPRILYFWRAHPGSVSTAIETKAYAVQAAHAAVAAQLKREREPGVVSSIPPYPSLYKVDYTLERKPLISVIIHGDASIEDLNRCIAAMENMTAYANMELIILQGNRPEKAMRRAAVRFPTVKPFTVVWQRSGEGELTALNRAIKECRGEILFFLHAEAVLTSRDWARELLMYAQREDVGAVGVKLCDGNARIYSGGVALVNKRSELLHHMHRSVPQGLQGYEAALMHVRNVTAVSGEVLMVSREKFTSVGGFCEEMGPYSFADLCLRLREKSLLNVWNPFVTAVFWGPDTCARSTPSIFLKAWAEKLAAQDPYYNPNIQERGIF